MRLAFRLRGQQRVVHAKLGQSPARLAFHRPDRTAHDLRHLCLGQVVEIAQHERDALARRELPKRLRQVGAALDPAEHPHGAGVFVLVPPNFDPSPDFREAQAVATTLTAALDAARPDKVVYLSTIGAQATRSNLLFR